MKIKTPLLLVALLLIFSNIFSYQSQVNAESNNSNYEDIIMNEIDNNNIELHTKLDNLNFNNIEVLNHDIDDENYLTVTVPISGEYSLTSNLTLVLDEQKNIIDYSETLVSKSNINTFKIQSFSNSNETQNEITDIPYTSDEDMLAEFEDYQNNPEKYKNDSNMVQPAGIGQVSACLAGILGVDLVVAKLIAGTCVSSCGAGVAPICAACVGGVATMGAANIGGIIACFNLW